MNGDLNDIEKARYEFACQAIFDRRKTQYSFLLFYLVATGACASVVIGSDDRDSLLLILLVPILLQLPVYGNWWRQRTSLRQYDSTRRKILHLENEAEEKWQRPETMIFNDVIFLAMPLAVVGLAWLLLRQNGAGSCMRNHDFVILLIAATASTMLSLLLVLFFCIRDSLKQAWKGAGVNGAQDDTTGIDGDE